MPIEYLAGYLAAISLLLLAGYIIYCRKEIVDAFSDITKNTWIVILILTFFAISVRFFLPPFEIIMYMDEHTYMQAANLFINNGHFTNYWRSIGWPFLLSIAFFVFGAGFKTAITLSIILGGLTVPLVFLLAYRIFKNEQLSLAAALIFSLFPAHIRWSSTAETGIVSLFFVVLSMIFCTIYLNKGNSKILWLALASLSFTAQLRPENFIYPIAFFITCLFSKKYKISLKWIIPWIIFMLIAFPNFLNVYKVEMSEDWLYVESEGQIKNSNFGLSNLIHNSYDYGIIIFNTEYQPMIFSMLLTIGIGFAIWKRVGGILWPWLILLWIVYFASYFQTLGGSMEIDPKTRFFMAFYPMTCIFMAYGMLAVKKMIAYRKLREYSIPLMILIVATLFLSYTVYDSTMMSESAAKLEQRTAGMIKEDMMNCTFITKFPEIILSEKYVDVMSFDEFLSRDKDEECMILVEDEYCLDWDVAKSFEQCNQIKDLYEIKRINSIAADGYEYSLYLLII